MLIFEIIPSLYPIGGAETFVLNLSKSIKKSGNNVAVVSLYDFSSTYIENVLKESDIKLFFLHKKSGIDFTCAREFRRIVLKYKPDVCHFHLGTFLTLFLSGVSKKQKNFYTFHTNVNKSIFGSPLKPYNHLLKRMIHKRTIIPVAISNIIKSNVESYFKFKNVDVVYNGVDISCFQNALNQKKKYTFISIGRMISLKNNLFMIKCFEKIKKEHPNINYLIIGKGELRKTCIEYCFQNNINDIDFIEETFEVNSYLASSECLLMGSKYEGNPLVINEAISSGVWVISTKVGGIPDIVNTTNGYLSNPDDFDDFCHCMRLFLNNRNIIFDKIIPDNIDKNREKISIDRATDEYLELFNKKK